MISDVCNLIVSAVKINFDKTNKDKNINGDENKNVCKGFRETRYYIINTDNIVEIWYNEYYCIEFANDDIGIWVNQDSYDKIIAAVGGLYNKESSQLSPKAYQ